MRIDGTPVIVNTFTADGSIDDWGHVANGLSTFSFVLEGDKIRSLVLTA